MKRYSLILVLFLSLFAGNLFAQTPQGSLSANGPFCSSGTGQLTWTATAGTGPYTIVYTENGGTQQTVVGATSGTPFPPATNPVTITTTYLIVSVTDESNSQTRNNGFTDGDAIITIEPLPLADVTGSKTICQNGTASVGAGEASASYGTILWTEDGAGTITSGATTLTPVYTAADGDGGNTVTLTMTVTSNNSCGTATATDTYTVFVDPLPLAVVSGSQTICAGSSATVAAGEANASSGSISWTENGAGSITAGATTLTPTYSTAPGDEGNTVTLTMTVTSNNTCGTATASDTYIINVDQLPVADVSGSRTICENGTATLDAGEATAFYGTISWTEDGAGTITSGTNTLTPTYTAGSGDAGNTVTLTMTVTSDNTCGSATASDTYTIVVEPLPLATVSGSQTICANGTASVGAGAASASYGTIQWTENGAGSITSGSATLTPVYTAAAADGGNTVILTMTVTSNNSCGTATASDTYSIFVDPLPVADVTGTGAVCEGSSVSVGPGEANALYGTIFWTENGAGSITSGSTTLTPVYSSATGDAGNNVTLTMTVTSNNSCGTATASDTYTITVNPRPVPVIAGPDRACITSSGNLYTTAESMSGYDWDISSDGTITGGGGMTNSSVTITWTDNGAQTVRVNYIDGNGCTATSQTNYNVTVIEKPAPVNVQFTGTLREFSTLTASYDYIPDVCFAEVPENTEISWYRANNGSGGNSSLIATKPGTDKTLVLSANEQGKYIRIKVKLHDGATLMDAVWSSDWVGPVEANAVPQALSVSVSGTLLLNNTLSGNYTYSDAENDEEGATTFQWYRANDNSGSGSASITGATSQTYTLTPSDRTKYIRFRVTPKAQTGTITGSAVYSPWVGPVVDNPPVASNVSVAGTARVGNVLTGIYQYSDIDGDPQGSSIMQWYTGTSSSGAGAAAIASATGASLILTNSLIGSYIGFSVTPVAQQGISPGTTATTATWIGPVFNDPPVATILPITGLLDVNSLLTGHYIYSDIEGDIESGSLFQWYSSTVQTGTYTEIPGETSIAHVINNSEQGLYFKIRITPVAATGNILTGAWIESAPVGRANSQPAASSVMISGAAEVGVTLTGTYIYNDPDLTDTEGTSTFRWLRNGSVPIAGATGTSYLVKSEDEGYRLSFEVTPVSTPGYPYSGTPVQSSLTSPVVDPSPATPIASQVCIEGIRAAGQILRGKYFYDFYKSEGTSTYQWYRNGVAISGATGIQYTLLQAEDIDSNADITFEVTPESSNVPAKVGIKVSSRPLARIIIPKDQYSVSESDVTLSSNVIDLGGVFSGTGVTGTTFSPKTAGSAGSPYTLSYLLNIVEAAHNCSQQASKIVTVNPNVSTFVGFDPLYCHDSGPDLITVTGVPAGSTIIGFTISDNKGIVSQSGTSVTIDPGRMRPGIDKDVLFFSYNYMGTFYQISNAFRIDSVGTETRIINLNDAYCENAAREYISVEGIYPVGGTADWTGTIISDMRPASAYVDPLLGAAGTSYAISYQYTSPRGCKSALLRDTVKINPLPNPYFLLDQTYNIDGGPILLQADQPGGTFTGNGVSGDKMFPDIAGLGEHEIIYSITDITGCFSSYPRKTTIREAQGIFTDIPAVICYSDTTYDVKVTGLPAGVTITEFTNSKNTLVHTTGASTAGYNVPAAGKGADTLFLKYDWDNVEYSIYKALKVDSIGDVFIKNLNPTDLICDNNGLKELFPSITGGIFTGPVIGNYLDPAKGLGPASVSYIYTNMETGCSKTAIVPITIYSAPKVLFEPLDYCIEDETDTTFFANNTTSSDTVESWLWEFADAEGTKKKFIRDGWNIYRSGGLQMITLSATTVNGCTASWGSAFNFGIRPDADFTWLSDCMHEGESIILIDKTISTSPVDTTSWSLFNQPPFSFNEDTARYPKTAPGYMRIQHIVSTTYDNCADTVLRDIFIKPTITVSSDGYFENFETGAGSWIKGESENNTWSFGSPARGEINNAASGEYAWYTSFDMDKPNSESSSVVSPCFDFQTTERPLIKMNLWKRFTRDIDGAALQYRIGDTEWRTVGAIDDGINWYNSAVIRGRPGGSQLGWTTRGLPDTCWVESIHALDELKGKQDVVFRISYGSDGTKTDYEGLAFDDLWIGERSRNILLEHFTNINDLASTTANALVDTIIENRSKDVIGIQYHTNFPGNDPYYDENPGESGARILFYGLTRAPYTIVDGGSTTSDFSYMYSYTSAITKIDSNDITKRSLIPSRFDISLRVDVFDRELKISGTLTALEDTGIEKPENLALFIAVTEKRNSRYTAIEFWNVFRKFIPDGGGIQLRSTWHGGENQPIPDQTWVIDKLINNSDIEVIAFIQNTITKEVYQSTSVLCNNIVGINDSPAGMKNNFIMYPNPVINRLTIEFNEPLDDNTDITIYDMQGRPVLTYKAEAGSGYYVIDNLKLKQGLYMVRILCRGSDIGSRRLVVSGR